MKKINGFEMYLVGSDGSVFSTKTNIYLKHIYGGFGYPCVNFPIPGKNKNKLFKVHRLVAEHYLPNPNNYPIVRHLDGNPKNCHVDNLMWGNQKDNLEDSRRHKTLAVGERIGNSKLKNKDVANIRKRILSVKKYAEQYNVSQRTIYLIQTNKTWKHI